MKRRTFDRLIATGGLGVAAVLLITGGLSFWGYSFANSSVHNQLAAQKIYFPPAGSAALKPALIGPYLDQYAGQQVVNGKQAQAYANHFIAVHLGEVAGGQTYAQVSTAALASPNNAALQAKAATLFKGTTLRSMLLNAYAFWQLGQIALWAAVASFVFALIFGVFSALGFWHAGRVEPEVEIFAASAPAPALVS